METKNLKKLFKIQNKDHKEIYFKHTKNNNFYFGKYKKKLYELNQISKLQLIKKFKKGIMPISPLYKIGQSIKLNMDYKKIWVKENDFKKIQKLEEKFKLSRVAVITKIIEKWD
jgi:hypothetical protein